MVNDETSAPLRVELRPYLAGVPFSHRREISAKERRSLRFKVAPYLAFAAVMGLASISLLGYAIRFFFLALTVVDRSSIFLFFILISISLVVTAACLHWAAPFLRTLRSGRLDVYIGSMRPLHGFDAAQAYYLKRRGFRANLDRYVEVLAVGDGDRIWQIEGVGNATSLSGVRIVRVAVVPDIDEKGTRALTDEEARELLHRSIEYGNFSLEAVNLMAAGVLGLILFGLLFWVSQNPWIGLTGFLVLTLGSLVRDIAVYLPRHRFGKILADDEYARVVVNGALASGIPWVVNGEPARWRLGWTNGTPNAVSLTGALALEEVAEKT